MSVSMVVSQAKPPTKKPAPVKATFAKHVAPYIKNYCVSCHTGKDAPDKIDFSIIKKEEDAKKNIKWFTKGAHEVAEKKMPPKGMTQPKAEETKMFAAWVKANTPKTK
ncbi:MAG: hypothetical protein KF784_00810 [Fimbriimonadaceae bacterium]|nr:hypothetical protein [Fimbriimonadaceae bacterium]